MPRESAQSKSILRIVKDARLPPPPELNPAQAKIWTTIVDSKSPDYFAAGDAPLLKAYCVATYWHEEASKDLSEKGMVLLNKRGTQIQNPAAAIMAAQAATMAQLSQKLRLAQSSRYDPHKGAGRKQPLAGRKPWQFGQDV